MPFKDASRSERVAVPFLIAGGEFNADIYQQVVAVYGEHCLDPTPWNSSSIKVFEKGSKRYWIYIKISALRLA
ncbi:hypothetical protein TNCV_1789071 [Trichonephila clavipes]|nr:hypothetical protein TNCV_1789071 [Trichonephila clavipes]